MTDESRTNVVFGIDAKRELLKGLNVVADAVGCTLGPRGRTVLIKQEDSLPILTKDGVTVSKWVKLDDPVHSLGASLVQQAAELTNSVAGDGTTTATVITQAFVNGVMKLLVNDMDPASLVHAIEVGTQHVVSRLKVSSRKVSDGDLERIATISANGSCEIGKVVSDSLKLVTKDGIVTLENTKGTTTTVKVVPGMTINRGFVTPHFINDQERMIAAYESCKVLITNDKLSELSDIIDLLGELASSRQNLLIIADDVEGNALQGLILNRTRNNIPVVAIKAPGFGSDRIDLLNDIAAMTGAKIVGTISNTSLRAARMTDLGNCSVMVGRMNSTIVRTSTIDDERFTKRVTELRESLDDVTIDVERRNEIRARLASMTTGAAIISVGGLTDIDVRERHDRIEDALNATKAAVEEGIVAGGGIALHEASIGLLNDTPPSKQGIDKASFEAGLRLVNDACKAPLRRILKNAGLNYDTVVAKLSNDVGFDAKLEKHVNMFESGIIDPMKVTRSAFEHASSVATSFINLDAVIV